MTTATREIAALPPGLSTLQAQCALLFALGESMSEVSRKLEISRTTLHKWKRQEPFSLYLQELTNELVNENAARGHGLVSRAMDGLSGLMTSENEMVRLKACLGIMKNLGPRIAEKHDLFSDWSEDRLRSELERVQAAILSSDIRRSQNAEWRELKDSEAHPTTNPLTDKLRLSESQGDEAPRGEDSDGGKEIS